MVRLHVIEATVPPSSHEDTKPFTLLDGEGIAGVYSMKSKQTRNSILPGSLDRRQQPSTSPIHEFAVGYRGHHHRRRRQCTCFRLHTVPTTRWLCFAPTWVYQFGSSSGRRFCSSICRRDDAPVCTFGHLTLCAGWCVRAKLRYD